MTKIYLDQNKWIELARRVKDNGKDDRIYQSIYSRVKKGEWAIPISSIHVMETLKRSDKKSRANILSLMHRLSAGYSILSYDDVERVEVLNSFAKYYDPSKITPVEPLKSIPGFALGAIPVLEEDTELSPAYMAEISKLLKMSVEDPDMFFLILSLLDSPNVSQEDIEIDKEYLEAQKSDRIGLLKIPKQYRYKYFLGGNVKEVFKKHATAISSTFSISDENLFPSELKESQQDKVTEFLESMPTVDVRVKLSFDILVDESYGFDVNDSMDILFLSIAIPYTDIVVTERTWRHRATKMKLDKKYDTVVLQNIEDLLSQ